MASSSTFVPSKKGKKKQITEDMDLRPREDESVMNSDSEDEESQVSGIGRNNKRKREDVEDEEEVIHLTRGSKLAKTVRKQRKIFIDSNLALLNYNPNYPASKAHSIARLDAKDGNKISFAFSIQSRNLPALCAASLIFTRDPEVLQHLKSEPTLVAQIKEAYKDLMSSLK